MDRHRGAAGRRGHCDRQEARGGAASRGGGRCHAVELVGAHVTRAGAGDTALVGGGAAQAGIDRGAPGEERAGLGKAAV